MRGIFAALFVVTLVLLPAFCWAQEDAYADDANSSYNQSQARVYSDFDDIDALDSLDRRNLNAAKPTEQLPVNPQIKNKDSEWVLAPIPFYNPSQEWGLALVAQYIFSHKEGESPSVIGAAAFGTEKKSYGGAIGYLGRLREDRWRVGVALGTARMLTNFYGVGRFPQNKENSVLLQQDVKFAGLQVTPKIFDRLYVGLTLVAFELENTFPDFNMPAFIDEKLTTSTWVPGLKIEYDSRNDTFYPTKGGLLSGNALFHDKDFGENHDYQTYSLSYNRYFGLAPAHVLAMRGLAETVYGDVPFYSLPMFGSQSDLRGFEAGKYRDRVLWAAQAEYRYRFTDRWGLVLFAGMGQVVHDLDEVNFDDTLTSGGTGLRFKIASNNPVDFRVDVASGDGEISWYFSVGQAF
ncbi:BamA/TamA family outer membrane protein [Bdellovibrio sp. HCB117]|uniref:BamA/TamA family outer membrane protein n=1 Tax=Bdellovibrio TaxID=958 RepID=UPI0009BF4A27|nr:BamA/TamA family outer membrane protein [Bdellovibrio bacteriovorus]